ncbi:MAG: Txe/YoeB family addiction module toxin [Saprospiraceae bacterium]|nr:Txe/YoeB family addiction module toxin [Candidatus Vicinibacter affinis]
MSYYLEFTDKASEDIAAHKKSGNKTVLNKLLILLEELNDHPYTGTGRPEPLKHALSGLWSRRINHQHRLIYEVSDTIVYILSAKGHY